MYMYVHTTLQDCRIATSVVGIHVCEHTTQETTARLVMDSMDDARWLAAPIRLLYSHNHCIQLKCNWWRDKQTK